MRSPCQASSSSSLLRRFLQPIASLPQCFLMNPSYDLPECRVAHQPLLGMKPLLFRRSLVHRASQQPPPSHCHVIPGGPAVPRPSFVPPLGREALPEPLLVVVTTRQAAAVLGERSESYSMAEHQSLHLRGCVAYTLSIVDAPRLQLRASRASFAS